MCPSRRPKNSKQKYSKKKLLALDSQSGLLEVDTFFIPSCCVCQLVRDFGPLGGSSDGEESDSMGNADDRAVGSRSGGSDAAGADGSEQEPSSSTAATTTMADDPDDGFSATTESQADGSGGDSGSTRRR